MYMSCRAWPESNGWAALRPRLQSRPLMQRPVRVLAGAAPFLAGSRREKSTSPPWLDCRAGPAGLSRLWGSGATGRIRRAGPAQAREDAQGRQPGRQEAVGPTRRSVRIHLPARWQGGGNSEYRGGGCPQWPENMGGLVDWCTPSAARMIIMMACRAAVSGQPG